MTSTPPTGNREFRNEIVRLAELTVNTFVLEDLVFSNCRIFGPSVLVPRESEFTHCNWDAPGLDALFWPIDPSREQVVGAVAVVRCMFSSCSFSLVGLAGPPDLRQIMEAALNQS